MRELGGRNVMGSIFLNHFINNKKTLEDNHLIQYRRVEVMEQLFIINQKGVKMLKLKKIFIYSMLGLITHVEQLIQQEQFTVGLRLNFKKNVTLEFYKVILI